MSMLIAGLILVTVSFAALLIWVFLPRNRDRLEGHGELILDARKEQQGDQS